MSGHVPISNISLHNKAIGTESERQQNFKILAGMLPGPVDVLSSRAWGKRLTRISNTLPFTVYSDLAGWYINAEKTGRGCSRYGDRSADGEAELGRVVPVSLWSPVLGPQEFFYE